MLFNAALMVRKLGTDPDKEASGLSIFYSASVSSFFHALRIFQQLTDNVGRDGKVASESLSQKSSQMFAPSKLVLITLKKIAPNTAEGLSINLDVVRVRWDDERERLYQCWTAAKEKHLKVMGDEPSTIKTLDSCTNLIAQEGARSRRENDEIEARRHSEAGSIFTEAPLMPPLFEVVAPFQDYKIS